LQVRDGEAVGQSDVRGEAELVLDVALEAQDACAEGSVGAFGEVVALWVGRWGGRGGRGFGVGAEGEG
jgi:hypothetical protein